MHCRRPDFAVWQILELAIKICFFNRLQTARGLGTMESATNSPQNLSTDPIVENAE